MNKAFLYLIAILLIFSDAVVGHAQFYQVNNDLFWNTREGHALYSQGGGIFRFADPVTGKNKYYWYGVHYKEAETYRNTPSVTQTTNTFASVTCYSSEDFVNWTFENDVVTKEEINQYGKPTWVGRLGVAYIKELKKYALFVQHGAKVLILLSDTPAGNFTWHQEISMEPMIGTTNTGDQTVFTDEDNGKSYLVYSYGRGRNKIYVSEIGVKDGKVNLLDCTQVFKGESREGNCMFKYKGHYYMCASNIYGWDASYAYYLVADDIRGPYTPANDMQVMKGCADDYAHITQTGFFYTLKGSKQETVIYCGDRWCDFAGNGLGYNQWFPLSFEGQAPFFNSLSSWQLEEKTGLWKVAGDNNYVRNGSFEADRNAIPSNFKPVQEQLTGWASVVLEGNAIHVGDSSSPILNYFNRENDRKTVTGEKSLRISDKVSFKRKVYQEISTTPFVPLKDGLYTLTAWIRNSGGFNSLEMYAESNGKKMSSSVTKENDSWKKIVISGIPISNGKAEIGFIAAGIADSFCYIDDVSLVKQ